MSADIEAIRARLAVMPRSAKLALFHPPNITALLAEVDAWRADGVTEAMLRAGTGFIKLDNGCEIVLAGERAALLAEVERLTADKARLRPITPADAPAWHAANDEACAREVQP